MSRTPYRLAACALAAATLAAPAVMAQDAQRVVRDAETGQLRAPTVEEANAMSARAARAASTLRVAPATPLVKYHRSGATGARLTNEHLSHSVVSRNADGSLSEQCVTGAEAADAAVKSPAQPQRSAVELPTE